MFRVSTVQKWAKYGFLVTFLSLFVLNILLVYYILTNVTYAFITGVVIGIIGAVIIGRFEGIIAGIAAGIVDSIIFLLVLYIVESSTFGIHTNLIITGVAMEFIISIIGAIVGNLTRVGHLEFITTPR